MYENCGIDRVELNVIRGVPKCMLAWKDAGCPGQWLWNGEYLIIELAYRSYVAWGGKVSAVHFGRSLKELFGLKGIRRVKQTVNGRRCWAYQMGGI